MFLDFFTKWLRDRRLHGLPPEFRTALLPPVTYPLFLEVQELLKEIPVENLDERIKEGTIPTIPIPPALAEAIEAEEKEEKGRLERLESQLERKLEVRRIMRRRGGGRGVRTPGESPMENAQEEKKKTEEEQERKEERDVKMENPLCEDEVATNDKTSQDQKEEKEKEEDTRGSEGKGKEEEERKDVEKKKEDEGKKEEAEEREKEKEKEEEEKEDEDEKVVFAREYEEIEKQKLMCIPPPLQALPADGIVLYGPIQSALLAPEELLIHLLQSRRDVKISSMEILTGESLSSGAEVYPKPLRSLRTRRNEELLQMRLARKGGARREGGVPKRTGRSRKRARDSGVGDMSLSSSSSVDAKNNSEEASLTQNGGVKGEKKEEEDREGEMKETRVERVEREEEEVRKTKEEKKADDGEGSNPGNSGSVIKKAEDEALVKEEKGGLETVEEEAEEEDNDEYKSGCEEENNDNNHNSEGNSDDNTVDSKGEEKDEELEEEKGNKKKEGEVKKEPVEYDLQGLGDEREEKGRKMTKEEEEEDEEPRSSTKRLRTGGEDNKMSEDEERDFHGEKEREEDKKKNDTATLSSSHVEGETGDDEDEDGGSGVSRGLTPRPLASSMSLSELYTKGQGLYTQREIAYRLLEYRDEDRLRLYYIVKIQCADLQTFTWLLTHKFSRTRQQDIQAYPSNFYSLLYRRGKRKDKEALQRTADAILFGQGAGAAGGGGGAGMKEARSFHQNPRNFPSQGGRSGGRSSGSRMMMRILNREGPGGGGYDSGVYYANGSMRGGGGGIGGMILSPPSVIVPPYQAPQGNFMRGGEGFGPPQGGGQLLSSAA